MMDEPFTGRTALMKGLFGPLGHVPPAEFEAHYDHQLHESAMAA